jgi:hypothetical protein
MLDIFRKEPHGGVLWMGTTKDEKEVREIYKKFLAANPEYISPWTRARKPSAQSGRKSSTRTVSPSHKGHSGHLLDCAWPKCRAAFKMNGLRKQRVTLLLE